MKQTPETPRVAQFALWAVSVALLACAILLVAGVVGIRPIQGAAYACAPTPATAHCYGIAIWEGSPVGGRGGKADLTVSCIWSPDPSSGNFTTFELWTGIDGKTDGSNWIEEGMAYGNPVGDQRYWYWASRRPGYPYVEYDYPGMTTDLNTDYTTSIRYYSNNPSDTWKIDRDGTVVGTSVESPLDTQYLATGSELTADGGAVDGESNSLNWRDSSGNWNFDWSASGYGHAVLSSDSPQSASWANAYNDMVDTANPNSSHC